MKVLVLCEDYIKDGNYAMNYVHTRNINYLKSGLEVIVLNFREINKYSIDKVKVFGLRALLREFQLSEFDVVISHAPNIKNHIRFIYKHEHSIKKIVFFIHGHEVLYKDKYYPKPYSYQKKRQIKRIIHFIYDRVKVWFLEKAFNHLLNKKKCHFVFVSSWMKDHTLKHIKFNVDEFNRFSFIIPNPCNSSFFNFCHEPKDIQADYVTIRPLDNPKYCIDEVCKIALKNLDKSFHIYGKGSYFKYNKKPKNLSHFNYFLKHEEIPLILNKYKYALMPTRLDSQGVMVCELAAFGMPVITSRIDLNVKQFKDKSNIYFLEQDHKLPPIINAKVRENQYEEFSCESITEKEIEVFQL